MKINVHIERLILDELPINRAQSHVVQATVESELQRMLMNGQIAPEFRHDTVVAKHSGAGFEFNPKTTPRQFGTHIARSIHEGLSEPVSGRSSSGRT